jgi:transposase
VLQSWSPDAIVWDSASSHKARKVAQLGFSRVFLPAYSPELKPPERVFRDLRHQVEGIVYPSRHAKQLTIEQALRRLAAEPVRLKCLIEWDWIQVAVEALPLIPKPGDPTM